MPPGLTIRSAAAWLSIAAAAVLAVALTAVVVLRGRAGAPSGQDTLAAFTTPSPAHPSIAFDVQQANASALTISPSGGNARPVEVTLPAALAVYRLVPATAMDAAPGDWVTVVGVANEVLNFTIRQEVIIPAALGAAPDADGVPRVAGLAGNEANRDAQERPIVAGRVERVVGTRLTLATPSGEMTLECDGRSPLFRLTAAGSADIHAGDRLAYVPPYPGATLAEAPAVLVLPG